MPATPVYSGAVQILKNEIMRDIQLAQIKNDTYGNPRFVCHFLNIASTYEEAIKRAHKIGGRKFHNKQYGGGIVFQSYNTDRLIAKINEISEI